MLSNMFSYTETKRSEMITCIEQGMEMKSPKRLDGVGRSVLIYRI